MIETIQLPKTISEPELVYQDRLRSIYRKEAVFEGFSKQYLVSDTGQRAGILVACGPEVLLVRQYRLLINAISLEIPGGKVDDGENPETTAIRECEEETGVKCKNAELLLHYSPGLDVTNNPTFIFYSHNPVHTTIKKPELSAWIPLDTCLGMIFNGQILDAMTIIALLTYARRFYP